MKKLSKIGCALAGVTIALAGCQNDRPVPPVGDGTTGSLTVGVTSEVPTRASLADPTAVAAFENAIVGFDVYVFDWATGFLEATGSSPDASPVTIPGITTAGAKRIVVIANGAGMTGVPGLPDFGLTHYDDLAAASVSFANQLFDDPAIADPSGRGLLMTGENPAGFNVIADADNTINIAVRRVVAKIKLGNITFDRNLRLSDLQLFDIADAGIQKAIGSTRIGTGAIAPVLDPAPYYYGAYALTTATMTAAELLHTGIDLGGFISNMVTALAPADPDMTLDDAVAGATGFDAALLTKVTDAFWYVLPNDGSTGNPTLLTLRGSFDGREYYYPIEINSPDMNPPSNGNGAGQFIQRNTVYTLNVTFRDLIGTTDPNTPGKQVGITVTVSPEAWAGPVVQNTIW